MVALPCDESPFGLFHKMSSSGQAPRVGKRSPEHVLFLYAGAEIVAALPLPWSTVGP